MRVNGRPTSGESGGYRATIGIADQSTYVRYSHPNGAMRHEPQELRAVRGLYPAMLIVITGFAKIVGFACIMPILPRQLSSSRGKV